MAQVNKKGSSSVLLAMIFVAFAICIAGSIDISRRLVVKSECECFGRLWTRAILSEYDRHLLEDYGMMAYFGDEVYVSDTIDKYIEYSASGKLDARFSGTISELTGYELGEPSNFEKALKQSFANLAAGSLTGSSNRKKRPDSGNIDAGSDEEVSESSDNRKIGNTVVLDTLPSNGMGSSLSGDRLDDKLISAGSADRKQRS